MVGPHTLHSLIIEKRLIYTLLLWFYDYKRGKEISVCQTGIIMSGGKGAMKI